MWVLAVPSFHKLYAKCVKLIPTMANEYLIFQNKFSALKCNKLYDDETCFTRVWDDQNEIALEEQYPDSFEQKS